jgi:hypothetical protein
MTLTDRTPLEELSGYPEFPPRTTLLRRVKLYCTWCLGDAPPLECTVTCCPLWAYRTGRGPKRPRSAAQLAHTANLLKSGQAFGRKATRAAPRVLAGTPRPTRA